MILKGFVAIDGNEFISKLEGTDWWDSFYDPAPDGYTATIGIDVMNKIIEDIQDNELFALHSYMEKNKNKKFILYFD